MLLYLKMKSRPPRHYAAMRDKDVMRARSIRGQSQETPPWTQGSSISDFRAWLHSDLRSQIVAMYDAFQIKLDQARVVRITNTAVDETEETSSDGPGGQEDQ